MQGFVLQLKRVNPTLNRSVIHAEVEGIDRFIADVVQIPEERRGLYMNEEEALRFSNGRILMDQERKEFESEQEMMRYRRELEEKLNRLQTLYEEQFQQRASPEQIK